MRFVSLALALSILGGCKGRERAAPAKAPEEPLVVEVAGCAAVVAGPVCELGAERALRMWVDAPEGTAPTVRAAEVIAVAGVTRIDNGWALPRVVVPAGAQEVRVEAGARAFTLRVRDAAKVAWLDDAKALRNAGKLDEAAARLEPGLHATGAEHARALGLLARIELARGKMEEATGRFREAIGEDRLNGLRSDAVIDTFAMTYALVERGHHFAEARAALDALGESFPVDAEHRASEPYYRALIARNSGDLRSALPLLRDAEARALRLGLTRRLLSARQAMGLLLNELGRFDEALALFETTSDVPDATPCDRVAVATNQAHALLLLAEDGDRSRLETAKATIARAVPEACADALFRGRLFIELALVDLAQDRPNDAKEHLSQARALVVSKTGGFMVLSLELEGRIALARRDLAAALKAFDEEARISEGSFLARGVWSAMVGRGAALEAQAKPEEAVRAYTAAEDALDEAMLLAPLGEGRDTYMRERESSAKRLTGLLLRQHRARDAMLAARRSRGRFFAALQRADRLEGLEPAARARWEDAIGDYRRQRDALDAEAAGDWALSEHSLAEARAARKSRERQLREALDVALSVLGQTQAHAPSAYSPPEPGTLRLLYHPIEKGWVGFAIDASHVDAQRIGIVDPKAPAETLAHVLFDPFRAAIVRATRVKLLTFGALRVIDIHALPFEGAPLAATKLVEYGLDIPPPTAMNTALRALIVADPTGDLAAAAGEADAVEAALRARTKDVEVLRGPAATSRDVLQRFASATLFHYAGHGVFGGVGGSDSALPLAAGSRIAVGDVLALAQAPRIVVLSACEGGRTAANAAPEGLGLAQAFVAAGSSAVIAPTRVVPDSLAAEIARRLYENGLDDDPAHAAEALERTIAAVSAQSPDADWRAFRLFTP